MGRKIIKSIIGTGIAILFIITSIPPLINGYNINDIQISFQHSQLKTSWFIDERAAKQLIEKIDKNPNVITMTNEKPVIITGGPMNSSWPMQSHDAYHTGLSPYTTAGNPGAEKWRFNSEYGSIEQSSAVIDTNGIIYFGTKGAGSLFALYPNGTKKWKYDVQPGTQVWSTPAIAEDDTIYIGTWGGGYLYAVNPDGTQKWAICLTPYTNIDSSIIIGKDGTIYFGCENGRVYAVNPNGTVKWYYPTGGFVASCPAIHDDNIIYVGSSDGYLYALYLNGTICWRFKTGGWIKGNPTITDDGTIYVSSFDGYLYALYPNGTMKWSATTGHSVAGAGVALSPDGIIYIGTELLRAYYPNGTLKWSTDVHGSIYGTTPAVSADGTIYVSAGLDLVAVNPGGTERWRHTIADTNAYSSPCIGADGSVYVGSSWGGIMPYGYLHAFGNGPLRAEAGGSYSGLASHTPVQCNGLVFGGFPPYAYLWDFGDGNTSVEENPSHLYRNIGSYNITFTVTDDEGNMSTDTTTATVTYGPPLVSFLKPESAIYLANLKLWPFQHPLVFGKITIEADVTHPFLSIDRVEFYKWDHLQMTDTTPPYTWTWSERIPLRSTHKIGITIKAYTSETMGYNFMEITKFF